LSAQSRAGSNHQADSNTLINLQLIGLSENGYPSSIFRIKPDLEKTPWLQLSGRWLGLKMFLILYN
jgi:hypothetical protein